MKEQLGKRIERVLLGGVETNVVEESFSGSGSLFSCITYDAHVNSSDYANFALKCILSKSPTIRRKMTRKAS